MMIFGGVSEEKGVLLDRGLEDAATGLIRESLHKRNSVVVDELCDGIGSSGGQGTHFISLVVISLDDDNGIVFDTKGSLDLVTGREGKDVIVVARGCVSESLGGGRIGIREVTDNEGVICFLHMLKLFGGIDRGGHDTRLLLQPGDDLVSLTASVKFSGYTRTEELQGGEALNIVLRASDLVLSGINLG